MEIKRALRIGSRINSSTAGSILFVGANSVVSEDNINFFWDDTNNRLGIGTNTPAGKLVVDGSSDETQCLIQAHSVQTNNLVEWQDSSANVLSGVDERGVLFSDGGTSPTNTFVGDNAGKNTATGTGNVFVGKSTGQAIFSGHFNVGLGTNALYSISSGTGNICLGANAGILITTGSQNFALGTNALGFNVSGQNNVAIGVTALQKTTNSGNVGIGNSAGQNNSSGIRNVFIGETAGQNNLGSTSIMIGYQAGKNETGSNKLYISNSDTTTPLIYGEFDNAKLIFNGEVETASGIKRQNTRVTTTYTVLATDHHVFCNTDGGAFTVTLPAGVAGTEYRIINTGTSTNNLTISPNGAENLLGANSNFTLADGESLIIVWEPTDGWY